MAKAYELTDRNRKWSPGRTKALMALVAVVTAIAIWLVPVEKQPSRPSLPSIPSSPESSEALQLPPATGTSTETSMETAKDTSGETSEELTLPPPPGGIATITNGGDQARAFIYELRANGAQPDAEVVFAEAERMQGEGNREDAYLLYRFAARHGQAQAALILGTQADPAFHTTASGYLPEPDPAQAYKWYNVASAAGNKEAAQRLQDLHKRVQQEAAAGDAQARRLLLQWQ
jgi:TPR repeat protein